MCRALRISAYTPVRDSKTTININHVVMSTIKQSQAEQRACTVMEGVWATLHKCAPTEESGQPL